jgi:hypothetical protein
MASFSERHGYATARDALQLEHMDDNLRISIYNALYENLGVQANSIDADYICVKIWTIFWHGAIDEFPSYPNFYAQLKQWVKTCLWYRAYDLVEFIASECKQIDAENEGHPGITYGNASYSAYGHSYLEDFRNGINEALEREHAGYRLVGAFVIPITNSLELAEIDQTIQASDEFDTASTHLNKALELFAARKSPDYENTVKEAISAVEAAARTASGDEKATLGAAISIIQKNGGIHAALAEGWKKIYGFTSDAGGIRHAEHPDDIHVDEELAKYMLVSCSAFVNYLIESRDSTNASK